MEYKFNFTIGGLISNSFNASVRKATNNITILQSKLNDTSKAIAQIPPPNNLETIATKLNKVMNLKLLAPIGRGVIGFGHNIIETAANFEAGMSKVKAITGANETSMKLLTAQAKELGRTTKFSAMQSAEAMSYLGMAGWDTQQILKGMPALLSLAAAGGTDLARTADIVSDNLTAFGLAADKSMHMADVYATVISSTNTNIEMLGDTMKYAAPVAHAFGASMEETAALAGLMANSGIKAS